MKREDLFRKESMAAHSTSLEGNVVIAQPISMSCLVYFLFIALLIFIVFLATTSFSRKETVSGFLQPVGGVSRIVAHRNWSVASVYANEGDSVKKDQPILLLKDPQRIANGEDFFSLATASLNEQIINLEFRKEYIRQQEALQLRELEQRRALQRIQLEEMRAQKSLYSERLEINESRLENLISLNTLGLVASDEALVQRELVLNLRQQIAELKVALQTHFVQLEQIKGELARLPGESEQQLNTVDSEISRLRQQQAELESQTEILITSPIDGVVTNLLAEVGNQVLASGALVTILPRDTNFKAILLIPTRAYGFVQPGQMTRIRFDAFPYQRFGFFEGEITKVSRSVILPNDVNMPVNIQEPVYRIEVTLAVQEVNAYGDSLPLQDGMLLTADVILEERSFLFWLLEPLLSLRGRV